MGIEGFMSFGFMCRFEINLIKLCVFSSFVSKTSHFVFYAVVIMPESSIYIYPSSLLGSVHEVRANLLFPVVQCSSAPHSLQSCETHCQQQHSGKRRKNVVVLDRKETEKT